MNETIATVRLYNTSALARVLIPEKFVGMITKMENTTGAKYLTLIDGELLYTIPKKQVSIRSSSKAMSTGEATQFMERFTGIADIHLDERESYFEIVRSSKLVTGFSSDLTIIRKLLVRGCTCTRVKESGLWFEIARGQLSIRNEPSEAMKNMGRKLHEQHSEG